MAASPLKPVLRARFEPPAHGWLPLSLQAGPQTVAFAASTIPEDPLPVLIAALQGLLVAEHAVEVVWHGEPTTDVWRFGASGPLATLDVLRFADLRRLRGTGVPLLTT